MAFMMPMMMLIMNLVTLSILWFGGIRIDEGTTNIGNLMAFMQYAMQIMFSLLMLTMMFIMIPRAQAAADRINQVLETKPEISDPKEIRHANEKAGYIEFKDVTFSYQGAEEPQSAIFHFPQRPERRRPSSAVQAAENLQSSILFRVFMIPIQVKCLWTA